MTKITIQFDRSGNFRLVHEDGTKGEWARYESIATLEHEGKTYIAGTQYGLLPTAEKVYLLDDEGIQTCMEEVQGIRPR